MEMKARINLNNCDECPYFDKHEKYPYGICQELDIEVRAKGIHEDCEYKLDDDCIDTCPNCGCSEMLCGHGGVGCTSNQKSKG